MIEYKMNRLDAYNAPSHMDIGTFNDNFMKNKGVWPAEKRSVAMKKRSTANKSPSGRGTAKKSGSPSPGGSSRRKKLSSPGGYSSDGIDLNEFV